MAQVSSRFSFHYYLIFVKVGLASHPPQVVDQLIPSVDRFQLTRLRSDGFNHAADKPVGTLSQRQWGILSCGLGFEITSPVELVPASVLGGGW